MSASAENESECGVRGLPFALALAPALRPRSRTDSPRSLLDFDFTFAR